MAYFSKFPKGVYDIAGDKKLKLVTSASFLHLPFIEKTTISVPSKCPIPRPSVQFLVQAGWRATRWVYNYFKKLLFLALFITLQNGQNKNPKMSYS